MSILDKNRPKVFVVSDSLGETAEIVAKAVASQFNLSDIEIRRFPYVNNKKQVKEIISQSEGYNCLIAYTLVIPELKEYLEELVVEMGLEAVDILSPMLRAMERLLDRPPKLEPGLLRKLDEQYFKRVEAIEFAVRYDDGKDPKGLVKADIVLVGISRTSKTPLSMYLAHKRIKCANVPLVPEVSPPEELYQVKNKVVGLIIDPNHLYEIRKERLKSLGLTSNANYAAVERIIKELEYSDTVMKKIGCPVINVTNKAVEETAGTIMEIFYGGKFNE
ncbi:pyruvate, water dikinase regulatory protein [Desulfitibacter alkalitolerans]|uniref:pyruvate, water dikinase regulatory protein n=1 Tax=Desulfitibacter alkalitolerans TaxID=264641 RepID=UPI0004866F4E|nr:pyruvate, water dikinase regulatory protein [Desulfitibacter alkalitolerans]